MNGNVNMLFPDHVEQVNGLQVMLKGEDQKEGGCRPPPSAAVWGFHGGRRMDTLQAGVRERGAHGQKGVPAHGTLHSPQLCLTWESVLVDAGKDFISVGHSAEEQTLHHDYRPYLSLISIRHLDCLFIRLFTGSLINVRHYCLLTALLGRCYIMPGGWLQPAVLVKPAESPTLLCPFGPGSS